MLPPADQIGPVDRSAVLMPYYNREANVLRLAIYGGILFGVGVLYAMYYVNKRTRTVNARPGQPAQPNAAQPARVDPRVAQERARAAALAEEQVRARAAAVAADQEKRARTAATALDQQKLDGAWVLQKIHLGPPEKDQWKGTRLVIKGSKATARSPDDKPVTELAIKIDPSRTPKEVDIRPEGEKEVRAVYLLMDDTLYVAWNPRRKDRLQTTSLASLSGPDGDVLIELKREPH
jgi:uncharacterized protein (TIGR03067 family)